LCLVVFLLVGGVIHTLTARVVHPTATLQPAPINNSESQTNSDQGTAQKEPPPQRKGKVKSADNKRASQDQKAQIPEGTNPPVVLNNSPGSVLSFGQSGGITAGTVNIGPPEPKLTVSVISETPIQSPDNSSVVSEFRKRLAITTDRDTDKLSFTLIFDAPFTKAEVSTSFFNQIAVQEESLTTIAGEPAYMFSLKSPSMLRVNDAIYVDVYSRQPIKPVRFEKGLL
jgi:hypothetical protein